MLLGLPTLFGHSPLCAQPLKERKVRTNLDAHAALGLDKAQGGVIGDEFALVNLNYPLLARRILKQSWRFFACCVYIALVAAFPRHIYAPVDVQNASSSIQIVSDRAAWLYVPQSVVLKTNSFVQTAFLLNGSGLGTSPCPAYDGWGTYFESGASWISISGDSGEDPYATARRDHDRRTNSNRDHDRRKNSNRGRR